MTMTLGDSVLQDSRKTHPLGMEQYVGKPLFKGALEEGLGMMYLGDSASFLISTDSVNKYYPAKDASDNYSPNAFIRFDIGLLNIKSAIEVAAELEEKKRKLLYERKLLEEIELKRYLEDNHISPKPAKSGLYYLETEKGSGKNPSEGDTVTIHYSGMFLNGNMFVSSLKDSQPFSFVVGDERIIAGWNEGVKMMKKGGMATVILPSSLAFDSAGQVSNKTGKYIISPYTPLIFEFKLLDIKPKK
jgi:FKBP-type peptidyl-prolyl cis-trans isomerase